MNEKNEFEKENNNRLSQNNNSESNTDRSGEMDESKLPQHNGFREPTVEGITPEGERFAGATKEEATSMTSLDNEKRNKNNFSDDPFYTNTSNKNERTKSEMAPPVPPTRQRMNSGGGGSEPPKNSKSFLGHFLTGLIGVLVGGLIVFLITSNLNKDDGNIIDKNGNVESTPKKVENVSYKNSTDITKAVNKVQEAVVSVLNYQASNSLEDEFGGSSNPGPSNSQKEASSGSGVIYKKANGKAYVVTNNHVVKDASKLEVTFSNGKKTSAKKVGTDPWNDLAVLEISDKEVTKVAELGDSNALTVGETAIAIGSPLGKQFAGTVTKGIVSGLNRTVPADVNQDGKPDWEAEVIQTDAAINPGNSGGALVNFEGQVIGINSMKISTSTSNVEGIGFAIPSNTVKPIIDQLEKNGEVIRPSLGVTLRDMDTITEGQQQSILKLPKDVNYGAMIQDITSGSAAAKAGLKQHDVIVGIAGKKVANSIALRRVLYNNNLKMGEKIKVKFYRDGKLQTVDLTLEATKNTVQ